MKISIAVHGRFHAFELARELYRRGALAALATTYPAFAARRIVGRRANIHAAPWLELRRRLHQRFGLGRQPDAAIATAFGRFAARTAATEGDLLVGWSAATLEAIPVAHARGAPVVLERGSSHIAHQTALLTEAYARHGLTFDETPPQIIERELAEYAEADAIAVPSTFAATTFLARGVSPGKLIVNPYGVDLSRFAPVRSADGQRKPRILFVGRVGIRKGAPELLRAFAGLKDHAELHLVGPLEAGMREIMAGLPMDGVSVFGAVDGGRLPAIYNAADIFCLPSLEEGFPLVLLQAMACGLPVVGTAATGISDLVDNGRQGLIVPDGDGKALAEALGGLTADPARRREMAAYARTRVENGCGWGDYAARAMAHYERLLSGG